MNTDTSKILLSGIGLELTDAMKRFAKDKADRLFRHNHEIIRVRIEISLEISKVRAPTFLVRGIVELPGPDLVASVRSANAYGAIEKMVTLLDRKIRHRHRIRILKRARPKGIDLAAALPKVPLARSYR